MSTSSRRLRRISDRIRPEAAVHDSDPASRGLRLFLSGALAAGLLVAALRGGSYAVVERGEAFIAIWWVIAVGAAFGLLPHRRLSASGRLAAGALLALAVWTAVGLLWTSSAELTADEAVRVVGYAGLVALVGWTFEARDRGRVIGLLTVAAGVVCVLALASRVAPDVLTSATAQAGYHANRLSYPFNYWNALGCWAAMTFGLALSFSVHASRRLVWGASLGLASLTPTVAYLTYSRAAIGGLALAAVLVIAFSSRRWLAAFNAVIAVVTAAPVILVIRSTPDIAQARGTEGRWTVAAALVIGPLIAMLIALVAPHNRLAAAQLSRRSARRLGAVFAAVAIIAVAVAGPPVARDAWRSFRSSEPVVTTDPAKRLTTLGGSRRQLWTVAWKAFEAQPVHGIGAGTYEFTWNRSRERAGHVLDAHSLYLESLAELGLPGGVLVLVAIGALLVATVRAAVRTEEGDAKGAAVGCAAAFAVFCVAAGVDWMWESTSITFAGLVVGAVGTITERAPRGRRRWWMRGGLCVVAFGAMAVQLPALVAASSVRASQKEASRHDLVSAVGNASSAVRSQPWGASGYLQLALVLEQADQLPRATTAAEQAARRESLNWQNWLILARIRAERGQIRPALAAMKRARSLNPRAPLFQPGVARHYLG